MRGRMMRVLHINTERTWRGGEQQTLYLARGLKQRGHETQIACQPGSPLSARAREEGIEVAEIPMRAECDPVAIRALARLIASQQYDIVHMHTSHAHTLGCLASLLARRGARIVTRRVDFSIIKSPVSKLKYTWGITKYIAISEAIKRVLVNDGINPDRIAVVHSGIDISRFGKTLDNARVRNELHIDSNQPVIGNIAHMADHKGQKYLIQAVPEVLKEFPTAKFMIVGGGELRPDLEHYVEQLGIKSSVIFTGFRGDIPELLKAFDIFVMPSHMEGLCTSIMDAMAAGVPVVASNVGGIPEIVQNELNGLLVPAKNPSALAAAIIRLIKNPEQGIKFATVARKTVETNFSVDAMVEGNIAVYISGVLVRSAQAKGISESQPTAGK